MPQGLDVIFAGSGEFGVPTLRALVEAGHRLKAVVTQPDRPAGRGRGLTPTAIAHAAGTLGIEALRTQDINTEILPLADVMVVIAFGQKLADEVIRRPRFGTINLHASRLPRYRGAAPINWAILNGETVTGNSVIRLAQKMDAGAVLAITEVPIGEMETAGELHDRLAQGGVGVVLDVLRSLTDGSAIEQEQDHSVATIAPKLSRESARLDFTSPAVEVARKIRGMYPWPGCRVRLCDAAGGTIDTLRLVRARPGAHEGERWEPGEVMTDGLVATLDGGVEMVEIQPDGKRPMLLTDYRRGHRWHAGLRLIDAQLLQRS